MYFVYESCGDLGIVNLPNNVPWSLQGETLDDYPEIHLYVGDKDHYLGANFLSEDYDIPEHAFTDFCNDLIQHILQKLTVEPAPQVIYFTREMYHLIQDSYLDKWVKEGFFEYPSDVEDLRNWKE